MSDASQNRLGFYPVAGSGRKELRDHRGYLREFAREYRSWNGWTIRLGLPSMRYRPSGHVLGRTPLQPFRWDVYRPDGSFVGSECSLYYAVGAALDAGMFRASPITDAASSGRSLSPCGSGTSGR